MRDGVALAADVWRPAGEQPVPVLLQRTPYDRRDTHVGVHHAGLEPLRAVDAGWAVVIVDVRGRFGSEGTFDPFAAEAADGVDVVAWLREQDWCDGRVCPYGTSYPGATALLAAAAAPDAVAAFAASETGAPADGSWFQTGGATELSFPLTWATETLAGPELADLATDDAPAGRRPHADPGPDDAPAGRRPHADVDPADAAADLAARLRHPAAALAGADAVAAHARDRSAPPMRGSGPFSAPDGLGAVERLVPALRGWLEDPDAARYWRGATLTDITAPGLHVGGWHDLFLAGTLATYTGLRDAGHAPQRLVVGPWAHGVTGSRVGERDFGPDAAQSALDLTAVQLEFFAAALTGGLDAVPPVRLFLMGADRWTTEDAWPPARTRTVRLYLRGDETGAARAGDGRLDPAAPGDGRLNLAALRDGDPAAPGDGRLSLAAPENEPADAFDHDPGYPVPTAGGPVALPAALGLPGVADQAAVEARADVLVYTSDPLPGPVELIGPVTASVWAASSVDASDWTVKLVEVDPDGRSWNVCDGVRRAHGARPDEPARHDVDLGATALRVPAGHRLRVLVASTNFPRFTRCPDRPARQRVFHDAARPSAIDLPLAAGALAA